MTSAVTDVIDHLRHLATETAGLAHVPYSGREEACVILLSDGSWLPGARIESASYSLTIPAFLSALSNATGLGHRDIVALVQSGPLLPTERAFLHDLAGSPLRPVAEDAFVAADISALPDPGDRLLPFLSAPLPESPSAGIELARQVSSRATVPESDFAVGVVLETASGELIPGVNVEYPDWSRILCAERGALCTALSYGKRDLRRMFLTCRRQDSACTPCGACRQLLAELAPEIELWMDLGAAEPLHARALDLLPDFFTGSKRHPATPLSATTL